MIIERKSIMFRKLITLMFFLGIMILLVGCGIETTTFNNLEEMQDTFNDDLYYFDVDSEIFGEAKDISVREWTNSTHNGKPILRYSIWYDIVDDSNAQDYRLNIVGSHLRHPITINGNRITTNKLIPNATVIEIEDIDDYFYYFILQGSEHIPSENEIEYYRPIIQSIIETQHQAG